MRGFLCAVGVAVCLGLIGASSAWADLMVISLPSATYQSMTTEIPITAADNLDATNPNISSLSDGNLTINFSTKVEPRTVPTSWALWSSPPNSETATPRLLYLPTSPSSMAVSVTLSFNKPVKEFGVEMEQNSFLASTLEADFYNGPVTLADLVGSIIIPLAAEAPGSARLFAASTTTSQFTEVVLSADFNAQGMGIAAFRYAGVVGAQVPEPSSFGLTGLVIAMAGCAWRRREHNR